MSKSIMWFPVRLLGYIPDFSKLTYRSHTNKYKIMRDFYNKKSHQLLTVIEVAEYLGISEQKLLDHIPEHERKF